LKLRSFVVDNRLNLVIRIVQAGPNQVIHAGIDYDKVLDRSFLGVEHPRHQNGLVQKSSRNQAHQPPAEAPGRIL
jgi:hypothetical protein